MSYQSDHSPPETDTLENVPLLQEPPTSLPGLGLGLPCFLPTAGLFLRRFFPKIPARGSKLRFIFLFVGFGDVSANLFHSRASQHTTGPVVREDTKKAQKQPKNAKNRPSRPDAIAS
jgi:hypothetical protein